MKIKENLIRGDEVMFDQLVALHSISRLAGAHLYPVIVMYSHVPQPGPHLSGRITECVE